MRLTGMNNELMTDALSSSEIDGFRPWVVQSSGSTNPSDWVNHENSSAEHIVAYAAMGRVTLGASFVRFVDSGNAAICPGSLIERSDCPHA